MASEIPTIRWGIVATGLISSWFVKDITMPRADARAKHVIQAVSSSSSEKGRAFVEEHLPGQTPTVYGGYSELYGDPDVDVVYIGTPHAFHKQNCLDAIAGGKHVLCEKAFTLNAREAEEVFAAARAKGVFVMEAMWTRFFPLVRKLRSLIHEDRVIGDVHRTFCDFAMDQKIASLGPESRLKNPALGAGSLLDIGVYSLTFVLLAMDGKIGEQAEKPKVVAAQSLSDGIDIASSITLLYEGARQGIATTSTSVKTPEVFCRIQGSAGTITVEGIATSVPRSFTVENSEGEKKFEFEKPGMGFYYEADAVALDIASGRRQNDIMPWAESLRVLQILDEVRRQGGARFPQDDS